MRLVHLLGFALGASMIVAGSLGACSSTPSILRAASDVLDVLCETRDPLRTAQACRDDIGCQIDVIKAYLIEHQDDAEVAALLQLLEAQVHKIEFAEPPKDWGF